ncbi:MAG TPA: FAD-binding oxidoreductase, partial [Opitutales bacterium]|nr:FAD-binding oxidoreductase [Opitutales bacterium]
LGSGILLVYPAHLNQVKFYDAKSAEITVEAGINFGKLQQLLQSYEHFIPAAPTSLEYSTIGGAVANNAASRRSFKYGSMRQYVRGLRVVLANGEVIETERISKRELNRKLGLSTFEGEIYRALDALLEENRSVVEKSRLAVSKNASGYALSEIVEKDGSFDLTPLFVGSQGTLGLITEVTLSSEPYTPKTSLVTSYFTNADDLQAAVLELREQDPVPSALEMVDSALLEAVAKENPNYLKDVIKPPYPKFILLVEFDNISEHDRSKGAKKAMKILSKHSENVFNENDPDKQKLVWKIRDASALFSGHPQGRSNPLPLIDDGVVQPEKLASFLSSIYDQFKREHIDVAIWGSAGDANLHIEPNLDLSQVGDRQKAFRMLEGRLRGPYMSKIYPEDVIQLFAKVKKIFDPYDTLNPGVKINVSADAVRPLLRDKYSLEHVYDHLPLS